MRSPRSATGSRFEIVADLPPDKVLARLRSSVGQETALGGIIWDTTDREYVGSFDGMKFRIRIARRTPQFYATHVFGRVEDRDRGSVVVFHFGRRTSASVALWIIRIAGALLVGGALLAAFQEPLEPIFLFAALWVAAGIGSMLWLYRLRPRDRDRLRKLILASVGSHGP